MHSIGDPVITTDARGVTGYLNPVAEALTGWTAAEALGRPLGEVEARLGAFEIGKRRRAHDAPRQPGNC